MRLLLDTHIWIWWVLGLNAITAREREALGAAAELGGIALSSISLWEVQMLHSLGRVELDRPFETWLIEATAPDVVQVLPLDVPVVLALDNLPESFHGDPADRIIVATARAYDLPLMTRPRDPPLARGTVVQRSLRSAGSSRSPRPCPAINAALRAVQDALLASRWSRATSRPMPPFSERRRPRRLSRERPRSWRSGGLPVYRG